MVLERRIKKRNLNNLDILIQDTSNEFLQVFDVPDVLPQGRSAFAINGSEFLKINTEVLVELLDNNNNPIFVNPIYDPSYVTMQGTSRAIGVEVYPTTPPGRALLTIVGELDHTKFIGSEPLTPELIAQLNIETDPIFTGEVSVASAVADNFFIPEEFRGVYNVKFNKIIQINPTARNSQPIRFYRKPSIQVEELIRTEVEASSSTFIDTVNVTTGSISGKRINPEKTLRLVDPAEISPVRAIISCNPKPAPQGGYTDDSGPNTLEGTIYNRSYPLELSSKDSYGSIIRRSWEFGDTHVTESFKIPDSTNPKGTPQRTHKYTKPGTYVAKLTVSSPTGQYDIDTETITLSAPPAPTANFESKHPSSSISDSTTKTTGSMDDDNSRTFKFKDTTTNVENISDPLVFGSKFSNLNDTEYSWSFGDGTTFNGLGSVGRNPEHTYTNSGSFTVALTAKNNYGTQTSTETKTNHILIQPSLPIVDFTVNSGSITQVQALGADANAIKGATATFTNTTVYYGSSISYAWNFGLSGSTSTATDPTNIYTGSFSAGKTFDITLTATDNFGRSVTKTKKGLVNIEPSVPQPNFSANVREFVLTGSFERRRVEFTDTSVTSSACTYKYDFNGGTTGSELISNTQSTTFEASALTGGLFEAGAKGGTLSITTENPRAGDKALKFLNNTATTHIDAYTYGYDFSNSGESTLAAWISQYSIATITQNHMYTMEFFARADEPTTLLMGLFGANADGNVFGAGSSDGTFVIKSFKVGKSWSKFNFTFKFTDVRCKYLTMRVGAAALRSNKAIYFDNIGVYKSTSTSKNPRIDYSVATIGNRGLVRQSVTNAVGTERSLQIEDFINAQYNAPSASFTIDDTSVQTQVPVTFEASGSNGFTDILQYNWQWGDGDFDITPNSRITHKYATAATYTPKLTVISAQGNSSTVSTDNVVVSAPPAPTVSLGFIDGSTVSGETPHEIAVKATTTNQVTSSNITFGNGDSSNSTTGFTVYKTPGTYTVTATVAGPGGSASDTLTINVASPPEPPLPPIDSIEDPDPNLSADVVKAAEVGTETGAAGGNESAPPAPYAGGGGGGDPYQGCVLAGTMIKTAKGDVPVEQVTTDDLVYTWNFKTNEFGYYKIEKAWSKKQPTRVFVETESGKSVECSDTHLFYHPDYKNQEICVKDLNVGDIVYSLNKDGEVFEDPIRNITTYDEEVEVYNFNVPEIFSYITNDIISHNREKFESGAPNPFAVPYRANVFSPETDFFEIETDQTGTFFNKEMLGAELTIFPSTGSTDMDTQNKSVPADRRFIVKQQPLVTKIRKIGAKGRVIVPDIRGLMVANRLNANKDVVFTEYQDFGPSSYSMSYQRPVTASFRVINKQSYTKLNLTQLRPYSGDISKVKVYYKEDGVVGGYRLLTESVLEAPEILADSSIQYGRLKIGYFPIQQHIDYYWNGRQGKNAGFFKGVDSGTTLSPTDVKPGLSYVNDPYIDSMRISGSNYPHDSVVSVFHKFPMRLIAGTEYSIRFQLAGIKKDKQHTPENAAITGETSRQAGKISFYLSGSSLSADEGWGHRLGTMELETKGVVSESFDYVEHNFIAENNGDGRLQLVVDSGEWYIGDLSVKPMRESGFSPDFSSIVVPTPKLQSRAANKSIDFYVEFYDLNGNVADIIAKLQESQDSSGSFKGSSTIIEGEDNTIAGSLFLGGETEGSGIEIHGGSSYIRNVGYVGYRSASLDTSLDDTSQGKAGFMMWSGSVLTDRTDEYAIGDAGFEIHGGPGVKDGSAGALRFRTSTGKLEVTGSVVATDGHFQNNFSVGTGSAAIEISASEHIMKTRNWNHPTSSKGWAISGSGEAYFQEGYIGGWQIKTIDDGTATERAIISGSNITLDAGGAAIYMSNKGPGSDDSSEASTFPIRADEYYMDFTPTSSEAITSTGYYIKFGPNFSIDKDGVLFASGAVFEGSITASAGLIGGFTTDDDALFSGTKGSETFFLSGSASGNTFTNNTNLFISSSGFQVSGDGNIKATAGTIGGFTLGENTLTATNFELNPSGKSITLGTGNTIFIADGDVGIHLGNSTFASAPFSVTNAGAIKAESGTVGGWTLASDTISSNNLVIHSSGRLETSTFQSGVKGWRISSENNGSAEFEQVTIRGTLKSAVFEKETVNAVGGQLYIANSTTITGSSDVGASDTVIQVANASGFAAGEVITAKKVTPTSISTEYMRVVSVAREDASSDSNFSGSLTVLRQYGLVSASGSGDSGSLGDTPGAQQTYGPGQVLVSTGKIDTGYIRLNANPNDTTTPYIDIVERTGSGVYDVGLKARLGDLSGLSSAQVGSSPGFGLFSENVFLTGKITATSGEIGGFGISSNSISSSNDNIILKDNGQVTASSLLLTGNSVQDFGSGKFQVTGSTGQMTASLAYIGNATNFFQVKDSGVAINTNTFDLNTTPLRISSSNGGTIALGSTAPTDLSSDGIFLTGSGDFNLQNGSSFIRGTSAGLEMNYPSFSVDTSGVITAQGANIAGTITAETGEIGSGSFRWEIDGDKIINSSDSSFSVEMNAGSGSEGFFLTSGSKTAQIVPEFTPSSVVLGGGGSNEFNFTGGTEGTTGQEITVNHDSSNTTAVRYAYNDGATTLAVDTSDPNNGATLTSGTKYKSILVLGLKSLVSLSNSGEVAGNYTVTGTVQLVNNDNSDAVIETHTISQTIPHDFVTIKNTTITVSTIHTPSSNHKYYWKLNALTVTNNNITEEYVVGSKTFTNDLNNTFDVFFKQSTHTPQNNLTEMAPGGFQAVFLSDSTLETSPNAYFKVDGTVSNQVDILGEATITGSLVVKSRNSTQKTTIQGGTLTSTQTITGNKLVSSGEVEVSAGSGIEFGTVAEIHYDSTDNQLEFFAGDQTTLDMTLSNGGALSTADDITAFATSLASDKRFKTNITPITNSLDKIKKLKGVEFDWYKEYDGKGHDIGFIAQEVREVSGLEPLVKESENLRLGDKSLNVSYSKLIPVLVEAIKEQQEQIDDLKKKLEES